MNHADILKKLRADVAAANPECPPERHMHSDKARDQARARIAALDGPALLERLASTMALAHLAHWDPHSGIVTVDKCGLDPCRGNNAALADAAKVLGV